MVLADLGSVPDGLASPLVERHDVCWFAGTPVDDEQMPVKDRSGRGAENMGQFAEIPAPCDLPRKITGDDARGIETGIDQLAVGRRRAGAERIVLMNRLRVRVGHLVPPPLLAGRSIETDQAANLPAVNRAGHKDR